MINRRKMAAGNWKMNGTSAQLSEIETILATHSVPNVDILLCPPATLVSRMADANGDAGVLIGGQDCHADASGAHTGDISAAMLLDAGAGYVILGHSERRTDHGEENEDVRAKARTALAAGLKVVRPERNHVSSHRHAC